MPFAGDAAIQLQMPVPLKVEFDRSDAGFAAAIAERTGHDDIEVHTMHWRSDYALSALLAERYQVGRVFLAGDAAHVRGANDALLDTYEEARREVATDMLICPLDCSTPPANAATYRAGANTCNWIWVIRHPRCCWTSVTTTRHSHRLPRTARATAGYGRTTAPFVFAIEIWGLDYAAL